MNLAPIALFVYNRPDHLAKTIEYLKNNLLASESDLIVFSDGHKNKEDQQSVEVVRILLGKISGFKKIKIIERENNYGLAKTVIEGVSEVVGKYGKVIVLEDDLVTSPYFLKYMNEALILYENDQDVISIHGYLYPVKQKLPETFFIKGADCWGWATWKRGWDLFEADGKKLLMELKINKLTNEFDFNGTYPYTRMLESQIFGWNNSWAVRWYASAFLLNKLTLYPGRSLVSNIGMDSSGTHSSQTNVYNVNLAKTAILVEKQEIVESKQAKIIFSEYFVALGYNTIFSQIKFAIKKILVCLQKNKQI